MYLMFKCYIRTVFVFVCCCFFEMVNFQLYYTTDILSLKNLNIFGD